MEDDRGEVKLSEGRRRIGFEAAGSACGVQSQQALCQPLDSLHLSRSAPARRRKAASAVAHESVTAAPFRVDQRAGTPAGNNAQEIASRPSQGG